MNEDELLVKCSCGHSDVCQVTDEFYKHKGNTVCIHNLWKHSPNWFRCDFDSHVIEFIGKKQYEYLKGVQKF